MDIVHEVVGDGPTLVFTHGWMMNRRVWDRQRVLSSQFRLILWDLPQHGESIQEASSLSLDDCADALHHIVRSLNLSQACYVGWSMGMSVFWRYIEKYGSAPFDRVLNVEMVPKLDPRLTMVRAVRKAMSQDREHATRKFVGNKVFYQAAEDEIEGFVRAACVLPLEAVLSVYEDMSVADFTQVASTYNGARCCVFGRHGFYAGHEDLLKMFFTDCPIHWFEHSAHAPFWEEAEAFNSLLAKFVGR